MKIETIYDSKMGTLTLFPFERIEEIEPIDIELVTGNIKAGESTDLNGFFSQEVVYLGMYANQLQFKVGESIDLFDRTIWCNSFSKVNESCLVTCYQAGTARDFQWKRGAWR